MRRRRRRIFLRLFFFFLIICVLVGGIVWVARLDAFSVNTIRVQGNQSVSTESILAISMNDASTSWMYVFPRKNILFYPTSKITSDLKSQYPELLDVAVTRANLSEINITVSEREAKGLWCIESNDLLLNPNADATNDQCYVFDSNGFIFATSTSPDDSFIRFYGKHIEAATAIGTTIQSSSTYSEISKLIDGLKGHGLPVARVLIKNPHEFSVYLDKGGEVMFSDVRPLDQSLLNLITAVESPAFKASSSKQSFEYIDTRFGNKIFFKLHSSPMPAISTSTASSSKIR